MTTDERLITLAAEDIIAGITGVTPMVLEDDTAGITLPCTVLAAKFKQEEEGSGLAKEYDLTIERRYLRHDATLSTEEDIYRRVGDALCPLTESGMTSPPSTVTNVFDFYRIEKQTDSKDTEGEVALRSRTWQVFARLK